MKMPYQSLEIEVPFDGLIAVEYFELQEALNAHGTVKIKFLADEDELEESLMQSDGAGRIAITEKGGDGDGKLVFSGRALSFYTRKERGLCYLWAEFAAHTQEWDLTPKSQSFCRLSRPYSEVIQNVLSEYPQKDIKDEVTTGAAIGNMLLQYEETDWEFLKRLASRFSTFLISDSSSSFGRAYFGLPELTYGTTLSYGEYQILRDQTEYDKIRLSRTEYAVTEILPQEMTKWRVKCRRRLYMAESVLFNGVEAVVTEVNIHTEKGELQKEYELSRKSGVLCSKSKNPRIYGMSVPATVKERSGNRIRVQMDIDTGYEAGEDQKYFTYAIESSSIYCMPEEGSRVHIYFPSHDEGDAIAVHAISMGGGGGRNPADKSFTTPAGMAMNMKPDHYSFDSGGSSLHIGIDGAFKLSGKSIQFVTPAAFDVGGEVPPQSIQAEAGASLVFSVGDTEISLTEEANIVSAFIAHVAAVKEAPEPSAEWVESAVKANDLEIMSQVNTAATEYLVDLGEKRSQAKAKVRHGLFDLLGTVLVVGAIVATGGLAAGPIAFVFAIGFTNRIVSDVTEIQQGAADWGKANRGDLSATENKFQSALGLSDEEYRNFIQVNNFIFDVVGMTALSVNIAKKAFQGISCLATRAKAKALSMAAVEGGKSALDEFAANGKDFSFSRIAMDSSIGYVSGGLGGLAGQGSVSLLKKLGINVSKFGGTVIRSVAGGTAGGLMDSGLRVGLLGEELTWGDVGRTISLYGVGGILSDATVDALTHDPIHVGWGAYLAREADLVLSGIREPFVWERTYHSKRKKQGILGRGWQVPYEGRLFREESGRLHVAVPNGALLFFEWRDGGYQETGKIKGRYALKFDDGKQLWNLTDLHIHQTLRYDRDGRLSAVVDRNGQQTALFYRNDELEQITTPQGHHLRFRFSNRRLAEVSDDIGRTVKYRYEGEHLTEVVNADGGALRYGYTEDGYLAEVTDPSGTTYLVNRYDRQGRVSSQVLWDGDTCSLEYIDGRDETTTHRNQGDTFYKFNKEKMPLCITYPDGTSLNYKYNGNNCCVYKKDRLGNEQFWDYDDYARVIHEKKPGNLEVFYEYDEAGDLAREWDSAGKETVFRYDAGHNVIEKKERVERQTEQWRTTAWEYDTLGRLTKKIYPSGRDVSYNYEDGCGKPVRTTYGNGETVYREYDRMERMMAKEDSGGRTEYGYNSRDDISLVRDGEGNETMRLYDCVGRLLYLYPPKADRRTGEGATQYHYNFMRNLDDIIYPDGTHERIQADWEGTVLKKVHPNAYDPDSDDGEGEIYDYDCNKNLIRIHYPDGGTERFFRDGHGNCLKHVLPEDYDSVSDDGAGYTYAYDAENRLCRVTGPDGTEEARYEYDLHGNKVCACTADGSAAYYWYDLLGRMTQKAEPVSKEHEEALYKRTGYTYDMDGNRTEEHRYGGSWRLIQKEAGSRLEPVKAGRDLHLFFTYDARGRLARVEDGDGAETRYAYDIRGNRTNETQRINDEVLKQTSYHYDRSGRLVEKREMIDSGLGKNQKPDILTAKTSYVRDPNGNIVEIRTPGGYRILREYDVRDRLLCERIIDEKNGIDRSTRAAYDRAGNLVSLRRKGIDTEEYAVEYRYDLKDRLIHAKDLEGAVFEYGYDKNDRLVKEHRPSAGKGVSLFQYAYDSHGRLTEKRNADGVVAEKNQYDSMGRQVSQKLADGEEVRLRYGIHGEVEEIGSPAGQKQGKALQSYCYNNRGQITGLLDGNGNETGYELDPWGNILQIQAADGGKEQYSYDYAGNITSAKDANGGMVTYRYNSLGKVCEVLDQEGNSEQFHYDHEGRMTLSIDRLGNRVETEYNVDGNPVRETSCARNGKHREVRVWEYDSLGYPKKAVGGGFSYRYEYRPDGKLLRKESGGRPILACTYYADGSLKTMSDVTGKTVSYDYDRDGKITSLRDDAGEEIVGYRHTPGGKLNEILHRSGVRTAYEYDTEGNVARLTSKTGDGVILCDLRYEYDLNGNRTAKAGGMALPGEDGGIKLMIRNIRYSYDRMGRLTSESAEDQECRYQYDLCGNRIAKESGDEREHYSYNQKNQLVERENKSGSWRYLFDGQGNLIKETGPEKNLHYEYNARNQQTRVLSENTCIQENLYDGENLRAGLVEQGKRSTFLFAGGEITAELNHTGSTSRYIRGYGAAALETDGVCHGIHQDEQLSTGWITGADGTIENAYEYDSFGNLLRNRMEVSNRILYGGQQYDTEPGQYYLRARYYNPVIGRFTQEDVYRGDGLNLYAYCANNPVVYYDPSGYAYEANGQAVENAKKENATVDEVGSGAGSGPGRKNNSPKIKDARFNKEGSGALEGSGGVNNPEAHSVVNYAKLKEQYRVAELGNDIVDNLTTTGKLPSKYITKSQAKALGWFEGKALNNYAPGKALGGDIFDNTTGVLPSSSGRVWYEADVGIDYTMSRSNSKNPAYRILYSNDGLIYGTYDHYETVFQINPQ